MKCFFLDLITTIQPSRDGFKRSNWRKSMSTLICKKMFNFLRTHSEVSLTQNICKQQLLDAQEVTYLSQWSDKQ